MRCGTQLGLLQGENNHNIFEEHIILEVESPPLCGGKMVFQGPMVDFYVVILSTLLAWGLWNVRDKKHVERHRWNHVAT